MKPDTLATFKEYVKNAPPDELEEFLKTLFKETPPSGHDSWHSAVTRLSDRDDKRTDGADLKK